jgi:hypothetical protein
MAIVAPGAMAREDGHFDRSPPLEAYLQALELFAETFKPAGGLRLLRIARPAILLYGLYNVSQLEDDYALFELISVRGTLATIFDGLFPSNAARGVQPQVLLDMLLLELDRGIDLLALGASAKVTGPKEWRAYAFWAIVSVIRNVVGGVYYNPNQPKPQLPQPGSPFEQFGNKHKWFQNDLTQIAKDYVAATQLVPGLHGTFHRYSNIQLTTVPAVLNEKEIKSMSEELRVQLSLEDRWENLVRTIAPEAGDQAKIFEVLKLVIEEAAFEVNVGALPRIAPPLPPQYEQSLATIARRI